VAAERRELEGIRKRFGRTAEIGWPDARFAWETKWQGDRWLMVASGPGPRLVERALAERTMFGAKRENMSGIISTGFCGALDPALQVGDIVVPGDVAFTTRLPFVRGEIFSADRVAVTAAEKGALRNRTGAVAVDMEAAAVKSKAAKWGVPFMCIRVVSDTAAGDLPLDFNRFRNADGNFSRTRIALAAMARPFSAMPGLMELDRNCRRASRALGDFLADCRF
jgi:adenosylhomocysteine nucleosidase